MKNLEMATYEQLKTIYMLLNNYTNHHLKKNPDDKVYEYDLGITKNSIKQAYIEFTHWDKEKDPINDYVNYIDSLKLDDEMRYNLKLNYVTSMQNLHRLKDNFSLSQQLMTKEFATKFLNYLLENLFESGIEVSTKILAMKDEQIRHQVIWQCLLNRYCVVCQATNGEHHHIESVNNVGGRAKDDGSIPMTCLCPKCHVSGVHSNADFREKHNNGIILNEFQKTVMKLKFGIFKGYFPDDESLVKGKKFLKIK